MIASCERCPIIEIKRLVEGHLGWNPKSNKDSSHEGLNSRDIINIEELFFERHGFRIRLMRGVVRRIRSYLMWHTSPTRWTIRGVRREINYLTLYIIFIDIDRIAMFYQREDILVIGQFNYFNLLAPARYGSKFKSKISNSWYRIVAWSVTVKWLSDVCHKTSPMEMVEVMAWCRQAQHNRKYCLHHPTLTCIITQRLHESWNNKIALLVMTKKRQCVHKEVSYPLQMKRIKYKSVTNSSIGHQLVTRALRSML